MALGDLTLLNTYPADGINGVKIDDTIGRKVLFAALISGGMKSYKYTNLGVVTYVDQYILTDVSSKMPGRDKINKIVMITSVPSPSGTPGVDSILYDDAANLTPASARVNPGGSGSNDVVLIPGATSIVVIASVAGVFSYSYNPATGAFIGQLDSALYTPTSYLIKGVAVDMTPGRELVFIASIIGTISVYKMNPTTGIFTYVTSDNRGALSGQAVKVIPAKRLMFFCADDRTDVYKYTDAGAITFSHSQPSNVLSEDIDFDTTSQIAFVADGGIYSYTYDDDGVMTPVDSAPVSGGGKGAIVDMGYRIIIEGSGSNGIRTFSYEAPSSSMAIFHRRRGGVSSGLL